MSGKSLTILVLGATGSIGRPVVDLATQRGHRVRALVRDPTRAQKLWPEAVTLIKGDVTRPETLAPAVAGIDAVVAVLNADDGGKVAAEAVYYTAIRDLLAAIGPRPVHVALMTTIGVTERGSAYNRAGEGHDWKRRAERLVRASGLPYTIVRPGWFDYNRPEERKIVMLQGDTRRTGTPRDGAVGRDQIARVLIDCLSLPEAKAKTFELITARGADQADLAPVFAALATDPPGAIDGVQDPDTQPLAQEPARVQADLQALWAR